MPGRVLIVDPVGTNRIILRCRLAAACYQVLQAESLDQAGMLLDQQTVDLILLDSGIERDAALTFCQAIAQRSDAAIPPVFILSDNATPEFIGKALASGAEEVLAKPVHEDLLLAQLRRPFRQKSTAEELHDRNLASSSLGFAEAPQGFQRRGHVALIAGTRQTVQAWKTALAPHCPHTIDALTREEILAWNKPEHFDVLVLSETFARSGEGHRLLSELRSRMATRHSKIIFMLNPKSTQGPELGVRAAMALDLGADDLQCDGFQSQELHLRIERQLSRKWHEDRLRNSVRDGLRHALQDPLTGLYNRRYAFPRLEQISQRAADQGTRFAVMVIDIDRFKQVNDTYGHAGGDAVLIEVSRRLRTHLRPKDLIARIGGEEFLVVLPDTAPSDARIIANELRKIIRSQPIALPQSKGGIHVTASIGVAISGACRESDPEFDPTSYDVDHLLSAADQALYHAKADGRDQTTLSRTAA
ncbi:MAG: diguanylate cyclase [Mangrovicoccus sp.]